MSNDTLNLTGEWIGYYQRHFDEVIKITQTGDQVEAAKITGDDYVPAGELTWHANMRTGDGKGQIAEKGFRNSRFIPGKLTVLSQERIVFNWTNCGRVEYRRRD
ncbi:MAG: Cyclin D1-binding domain-containing protein [Limisphaerales bacterium]